MSLEPPEVSSIRSTGSRQRISQIKPTSSPSKVDSSVTLNCSDPIWQLPLEDYTSKRQGDLSGRNLPKNVREFYRNQDALIDAYVAIQSGHDTREEDYQTNLAREHSLGILFIRISFFANLVLFVIKIIAAVLSGSLSVITAVIDSAMDLCSGTILWLSGKAIDEHDPYNYPEGRTRLVPVAIIVFVVLMSMVSLQMIIASTQRIIGFAKDDITHSEDSEQIVVTWDVITICCITIVVKFILFLLCRRIPEPGLRALALDHRNDVMSNTVALVCGIIGYRVWKYADPIGAFLISVYIIYSWIKTGWREMEMLTGRSASPDFLKKVTWIALNHHEKIKQVDTVRAFHFGNQFFVEVDIVLPEDMEVREAHDIGETLQCRLEHLEHVERAFVHVDYEATHHPQTEHKSN